MSDRVARSVAGARELGLARGQTEETGAIQMSLKAFHVVYIIAATTLLLGIGIWAGMDFVESGNKVHLALGFASVGGSIGLVRYGTWFMREMKGIGSL